MAGKPRLVLEDGSAQCSICKEIKPPSEFHFPKSCGGKPKSDCKSCGKKRTQEWWAANQEKVRANKLAWVKTPSGKKSSKNTKLKCTYGITLEQYERMLISQGGVCAICKAVPDANREWPLDVDHDHVTGRVRGLLCGPCNMLCGRLENEARISACLKYLSGR